jgi:hypothetical protein
MSILELAILVAHGIVVALEVLRLLSERRK